MYIFLSSSLHTSQCFFKHASYVVHALVLLILISKNPDLLWSMDWNQWILRITVHSRRILKFHSLALIDLVFSNLLVIVICGEPSKKAPSFTKEYKVLFLEYQIHQIVSRIFFINYKSTIFSRFICLFILMHC